MPFSLLCGDVIPGCSAEFQDESEDGLMGQVAKHAGDDHPDIILTPEVQEAVKAAVREDQRED